MAVKIYSGTSGYSYKEWVGSFYPDTLEPEDWLTYYSKQLPSVELNNTFYRMPKEHVVTAWCDSVPATFKFVIKASRRITHQSRLKNAQEATGYLVKRGALLGKKLGAVLFQLPPYMRADIERLNQFQALLPQDFPAVFEFRHPSWFEQDVKHALGEFGHGWVVSHDDETTPVDFHVSGSVAYLRLRNSQYTLPQLRKWRAAIDKSDAKNAFVFFKHEEAGAGPQLAKKFLGLAKPPQRASKRTPQASKKAGEQSA